MQLDRPIFIVGIGRCGSTIFHRILCEHPQISWLTGFADCKPSRPSMSGMIMKMADWPFAGSLVRRIYPSECYRFWEYHCPGFRRPFRDLLAEDVSDRSKNRVRNALNVVTTHRRPRLSMKITGWPRVGLLARIFPTAKFIHLGRDGRSVANSFMNVPWWRGWQGPENWRWGELADNYREEWEFHGRSFVALAGIQWKIFMDAFESAKKKLPDQNLLDLNYQELCSDPVGVYEKTLNFCGLQESASFSHSLEKFSLVDTGSKWRKDLSERQQQILNEVLAGYLEKYGYPNDGG